MTIRVIQGNPAMDRIQELEALDVGSVNRSSRTLVVPGGKGLNVARALRALGHPVAVYGLLGGMTGAFLRQACNRLGIADRHVAIEGDTRVCFILVDRQTQRSTVINEPGPTVRKEDEDRLIQSVVTDCRKGDLVVMAGSLAPGTRADLYGRLVSMVQASGANAIVDTSGDALAAVLGSAPWMVKANAGELQGVGLTTGSWPSQIQEGTEWIVATSGEDGAAARSRHSAWRASVPHVPVVNATGAGDIFLAGLVGRIALGAPMEQALQFAAAAAAGSVMSPDLPDADTVAQLLRKTTLAEVCP